MERQECNMTSVVLIVQHIRVIKWLMPLNSAQYTFKV